jgi:hypothetical protein
VPPLPRTRDQLLESIADKIKDYRQGEIPPRTPGDVDGWVRQFPEAVQRGILAEMDHVLSRVYISRQDCETAVAHVVTSDKLALPSPGLFWQKVNFLERSERMNGNAENQGVFVILSERSYEFRTEERVSG